MTFLNPIFKGFHRLLKFLSLTDRSGNLSITNIAVIVLITKMAIAPFDWVTAASLLVTLINYSHKRIEANKAAKEEAALAKNSALQEAINQVNSTLSIIQEKQAAQDSINDTLIKVADDTKSAISKNNLANAFQPVFKKDK